MIRALIDERFQLKVHRTERTIPVYRLTVAKGGARLQPSREGACAVVDPNHPPVIGPEQPQRPLCGERLRFGPLTRIDVHGMTMSRFAPALARRMDRDVVDATGLDGQFDFHLEFSPDGERYGSDGPSIFSAVETQLGLRLQPATETVEALVIDQVERPAEN